MWINGEVCPLPDTEMPICLPNRLEDIVALNCAMKLDEKDALAPYLLGCLYYDKRQYDEAIRLWERSAELNPDCPVYCIRMILFSAVRRKIPFFFDSGLDRTPKSGYL